MKTFIRQFVSVICIVALLLTLNVSVFASNEGLAFDMDALGITTGMDAQGRVGEYVRRDEFAQMVTGMIMQQDVAKSLENETYFTDVAEAIPETPIIMYNVPGRTGCNIQPATAVALAKNVKNIVGIKEASGDLSQVAKLMSLADGCIDLYSGNDDQILPCLSLGGLGVISVLSNVAPKETHDMVAKFLEGDVAAATKIQVDAIPLISALFCEVNPIPVKTALNLMGMEVGPLRRPLTAMEEANEKTLAKAMADFGIKLA